MKKFLDKLKKAISFGKSRTTDAEIEDSIDEFEDEFIEDGITDPNLELPPSQSQDNSIAEVSLDNETALDIDIHDLQLSTGTVDLTQPDLDLDADELTLEQTVPGVIPDELSLDDSGLLGLDDNKLEDKLLDDETIPDTPSIPSAQKVPDKTEVISFSPDDLEDETVADHDIAEVSNPSIPNLPLADELSHEYGGEHYGDGESAPKVSILSKLKSLFKRKKKEKPVEYFNDDDIYNYDSEAHSKPEKKPLSFLYFFQWIFSSQSRPKTHRYFLIIIFFVLFFTLGKILGLFITGNKIPKIASPAPVSQGAPITSRVTFSQFGAQDIFGANQAQITKKPEKTTDEINREEICLKANKKTSFPYFLVNTVVLQDSKKSVASIQIRSTPNLLDLREGDTFENRARIDRIGRLRVILKNLNTGACEHITNTKGNQVARPISIMAKSDANNKKKHLEEIQGIKNDGNKIEIKKSFLEEQMKDISALLTQAKAIPIDNPDGTISFRIVQIEAGSIFSYLNIENGDLITRINGKDITSQNEVLNLFAKLKTLSKLKLTVDRAGSSQELDYAFK